MLQLLNICKSYTTADFTQTALDNVSVLSLIHISEPTRP